MHFEIFVDYCLQGKNQWEHKQLDPSHFIEDDGITIDGWAQWLSAADYLRVSEDELDKTVVRIFVKGCDDYLTLKWTHWNEGKSWIFEQAGYYDGSEHFEISIKNEIIGEQKVESMLKLERGSKGHLELLHHSAEIIGERETTTLIHEKKVQRKKRHLS